MLPGRTNLIVRVPGTDPQAPSLMLMGHTDVVPADPSTWQVDPFGGNVRDGQVWGRGALDMLNWTASEAVGFAKALEEHGPFPGDLIFLALADEEAAGRYGARFLVEERWEDVACDYMVTELGGFFWDGHDGPKASITLGEKGVCWLKIKSKGVPGHGSMPYKAKNAARDLAKAFLCFFEYKDPLKASDIFKSMVQGMGLGESNIRDLLQEETWEMALDELYLQDPGRAKFLDTAGRTTFSPNGIHVGPRSTLSPKAVSFGSISASYPVKIRLASKPRSLRSSAPWWQTWKSALTTFTCQTFPHKTPPSIPQFQKYLMKHTLMPSWCPV
jgi:hypothetical protein